MNNQKYLFIGYYVKDGVEMTNNRVFVQPLFKGSMFTNLMLLIDLLPKFFIVKDFHGEGKVKVRFSRSREAGKEAGKGTDK